MFSFSINLAGARSKRLSLFDRREVAFRERTAGARFEGLFSKLRSSCHLVGKLQRHHSATRGAMPERVTTWPGVVPLESVVGRSEVRPT